MSFSFATNQIRAAIVALFVVGGLLLPTDQVEAARHRRTVRQVHKSARPIRQVPVMVFHGTYRWQSSGYQTNIGVPRSHGYEYQRNRFESRTAAGYNRVFGI